VSQKKSSVGTRMGIALIGLFFGALFLAPRFTVQRKFSLVSSPPSVALPKSFPINKALPVVTVSGKTASAATTSTLASLLANGKGYLLVNFWATWCAPCLEEIPSLEYLDRQLKAHPEHNIRVVTVSVDEGLPAIANLFSTLPFAPHFTVLHDKTSEFATSVGTAKYPETYLVDGTGKVYQKWIGPQDWLSRDVLLRMVRLVASSTPS
jgi:cytochrome c biogenesis protein CcmG/thiol:disulfide interchange protein DsbE